MMFAGGGLCLAMVATTMMMSGDVSRMREEAKAKQAAECAAAAAAPAAQPDLATPGDSFTAAPEGGSSAPDPACAPNASGGTDPAASQYTDPSVGGAVDPNAAVPADASSGYSDPASAAIASGF